MNLKGQFRSSRTCTYDQTSSGTINKQVQNGTMSAWKLILTHTVPSIGTLCVLKINICEKKRALTRPAESQMVGYYCHAEVSSLTGTLRACEMKPGRPGDKQLSCDILTTAKLNAVLV